MKQLLIALTLAGLLAGCAESAPSAPGSAAGAQPAQAWSVLPLGPGSSLTERGFYGSAVIDEDAPAVLSFYDFESMTQQVVCDVPGCSHTGEECPASGAGSLLYRMNDTLLAFGSNADEAYRYIYLRRYDAESGALLDTRTVLAGWQTVGAFSDGEFLYACIEGDLLQMDPESGLETVVLRNFLPQTQAPLGALNGRVVWQTSSDQTNQKALCLMADDFSLTEFFQYDESQSNLLCMDGERLYWADMTTGEIFSTDAQGTTQTVTKELMSYVWTRPEDGWRNTQIWGGQVVNGKLLVDVLVQPEDLGATCFAVDLTNGEAVPCTLTDYWNGYAHPVAVWAETDRGLLVSQHERVMRTAMGQDGGFSTYESARTLYGFIDADDFFAGRPEYRMIDSIEI